MVVPRKDGGTSALGIDINYGQISLTNRSTNEPIQTSNYKPSDVDAKKYELEEEKVNKENLERKMEEERRREEQKKKKKRRRRWTRMARRKKSSRRNVIKKHKNHLF